MLYPNFTNTSPPGGFVYLTVYEYVWLTLPRDTSRARPVLHNPLIGRQARYEHGIRVSQVKVAYQRLLWPAPYLGQVWLVRTAATELVQSVADNEVVVLMMRASFWRRNRAGLLVAREGV